MPLAAPPRVALAQMGLKSYERPACPPLPGGVADVDGLTAEVLRGLSVGDLQNAQANLEVSIFDLPPFDKVNEIFRRRSLSMAMFLQEDESLYPALIPNAKEVLRQLKGEDAEMNYVLGVAMLSCMEGKSSQQLAVQCLEKALEMQPDYPEAKAALAQATQPAAQSAAQPAMEKQAEQPKAVEEASSPPPSKSSVSSSTSDAAPPNGFEWGNTY